MRLIVYVDDILLMDQCLPASLSRDLRYVGNLLQDLGFLINGKKSVLVPSQRILFLRCMVDSVQASLSLPSREVAKIRQELRKVLASP